MKTTLICVLVLFFEIVELIPYNNEEWARQRAYRASKWPMDQNLPHQYQNTTSTPLQTVTPSNYVYQGSGYQRNVQPRRNYERYRPRNQYEMQNRNKLDQIATSSQRPFQNQYVKFAPSVGPENYYPLRRTVTDPYSAAFLNQRRNDRRYQPADRQRVGPQQTLVGNSEWNRDISASKPVVSVRPTPPDLRSIVGSSYPRQPPRRYDIQHSMPNPQDYHAPQKRRYVDLPPSTTVKYIDNLKSDNIPNIAMVNPRDINPYGRKKTEVNAGVTKEPQAHMPTRNFTAVHKQNIPFIKKINVYPEPVTENVYVVQPVDNPFITLHKPDTLIIYSPTEIEDVNGTHELNIVTATFPPIHNFNITKPNYNAMSLSTIPKNQGFITIPPTVHALQKANNTLPLFKMQDKTESHPVYKKPVEFIIIQDLRNERSSENKTNGVPNRITETETDFNALHINNTNSDTVPYVSSKYINNRNNSTIKNVNGTSELNIVTSPTPPNDIISKPKSNYNGNISTLIKPDNKSFITVLPSEHATEKLITLPTFDTQSKNTSHPIPSKSVEVTENHYHITQVDINTVPNNITTATTLPIDRLNVTRPDYNEKESSSIIPENEEFITVSTVEHATEAANALPTLDKQLKNESNSVHSKSIDVLEKQDITQDTNTVPNNITTETSPPINNLNITIPSSNVTNSTIQLENEEFVPNPPLESATESTNHTLSIVYQQSEIESHPDLTKSDEPSDYTSQTDKNTTPDRKRELVEEYILLSKNNTDSDTDTTSILNNNFTYSAEDQSAPHTIKNVTNDNGDSQLPYLNSNPLIAIEPVKRYTGIADFLDLPESNIKSSAEVLSQSRQNELELKRYTNFADAITPNKRLWPTQSTNKGNLNPYSDSPHKGNTYPQGSETKIVNAHPAANSPGPAVKRYTDIVGSIPPSIKNGDLVFNTQSQRSTKIENNVPQYPARVETKPTNDRFNDLAAPLSKRNTDVTSFITPFSKSIPKPAQSGRLYDSVDDSTRKKTSDNSVSRPSSGVTRYLNVVGPVKLPESDFSEHNIPSSFYKTKQNDLAPVEHRLKGRTGQLHPGPRHPIKLYTNIEGLTTNRPEVMPQATLSNSAYLLRSIGTEEINTKPLVNDKKMKEDDASDINLASPEVERYTDISSFINSSVFDGGDPNVGPKDSASLNDTPVDLRIVSSTEPVLESSLSSKDKLKTLIQDTIEAAPTERIDSKGIPTHKATDDDKPSLIPEIDVADLKNVDQPIVWFQTKDNFWDTLSSAKKQFDVVFFFEVHNSPIVEKDTKNTIFPNGTILQELVETIKMRREDSEPKVIKIVKVIKPEDEK